MAQNDTCTPFWGVQQKNFPARFARRDLYPHLCKRCAAPVSNQFVIISHSTQSLSGRYSLATVKDITFIVDASSPISFNSQHNHALSVSHFDTLPLAAALQLRGRLAQRITVKTLPTTVA